MDDPEERRIFTECVVLFLVASTLLVLLTAGELYQTNMALGYYQEPSAFGRFLIWLERLDDRLLEEPLKNLFHRISAYVDKISDPTNR